MTKNLSKFLPMDTSLVSNDGAKKSSLSTDTAKFLWLTANWKKLADFDYSAIKEADKDGWFAVLIAAACHQIGATDDCKALMQIAKKKNVSESLIKRVLYSNLLATIGRAKALKKLYEESLEYFKQSLECVIGEHAANTFINIRYISELSSLGLVPNAADAVKININNLDMSDRPSAIDAKLSMIKTELELVNHNIMLMHQKNQLYKHYNNGEESQSFEERIKSLSPSQLGQDLWVLERFSYKRGGFFIEFGATDGIMLSNTYLLEKEFGWNGLLAEPNPSFYEKLKMNRSSQCSNACIANKTGEHVSFVLADEFGGISDFALTGKHKGKVSSYKEQENEIEVSTVSLEDFLVQHKAPRYIEYLSIDTEGSEYSILRDFPFHNWDIQLITVEHNFEPQRDLIFELLSGFGYKRIESKWDDWYFKG